jgi:hypothetical protein
MTGLSREAERQARSETHGTLPRLRGQFRNWPESRSNDVSALLRTLLSHSQGNLSADIPRWLKLWTDRTGRQLPSEYAARAEYFETLSGEGDLAADQQAEIFRQLFPKDPGSGLTQALEAAVTRFLGATRPWFPLWHAYVDWTLQWCAHRGYSNIAFLCRDAVPFYVISKELRPRVARGRPRVTTSLVHASRRLAATPNFERHVLRAVPKEHVAIVDTGCYGSLIPQLIEIVKSRSLFERPPAVFFYFSRNPQIFGYVNYLAAWESLHGRHGPNELTSLSDFIVRAGDVVEALPKPYFVEELRDDGTPRVCLQDLVSFVLGAALISSLRAHVRAHKKPGADRDDALHTLQTLWKTCRSENDRAGSCALFSSTAPKSLPASDAYRHLWGLPPQDCLFGSASG